MPEEGTVTKTIELDCFPGSPRPDTWITGVIEGLGLELKEPSSMFFGNWEWSYPEVSDERWKEIQPILEERVRKLLAEGKIRYGSW